MVGDIVKTLVILYSVRGGGWEVILHSVRGGGRKVIPLKLRMAGFSRAVQWEVNCGQWEVGGISGKLCFCHCS